MPMGVSGDGCFLKTFVDAGMTPSSHCLVYRSSTDKLFLGEGLLGTLLHV